MHAFETGFELRAGLTRPVAYHFEYGLHSVLIGQILGPERHGQITRIMKSQNEYWPLAYKELLPTQVRATRSPPEHCAAVGKGAAQTPSRRFRTSEDRPHKAGLHFPVASGAGVVRLRRRFKSVRSHFGGTYKPRFVTQDYTVSCG